jgi:putative nucleotidyltransferase with HDIG domain
MPIFTIQDESTMIPKTKAEQLRQQIDSFPILPATVSRIMQVTASPESSADDLMQAILPDQSLCVTVLKLANSVLFGRPQRIDSLTTAIIVLGFNEVQSIALIKAMNNSFRELNLVTTAPIEQYWEHSFLTAMAAQHVAKRLRLASSTFFMAGLIHDIGKLVMLLTFEDEYAPEQWMTSFSTEERLVTEQQLFAFSHASLGGQLLRQWNFPENLLSAVEYHHAPIKAQAPLEQFLAQVIQLADLLSYLCIESDADEDRDVINGLEIFLPDLPARWRSMGMAWNDEHFTGWYRWLCKSREQSRGVREIFTA